MIHLSLRGEVEQTGIVYAVKSPDQEMAPEEILGIVAERWTETENKIIDPGEYPFKTEEEVKASVMRARKCS